MTTKPLSISVFITESHDIVIESIKDFNSVLQYLKTNESCNVIIFDSLKDTQSLLQRFIEFLDTNFNLVDDISPLMDEPNHVNIDLALR